MKALAFSKFLIGSSLANCCGLTWALNKNDRDIAKPMFKTYTKITDFNPNRV